jgi:hypothetical protein
MSYCMQSIGGVVSCFYPVCGAGVILKGWLYFPDKILDCGVCGGNEDYRSHAKIRYSVRICPFKRCSIHSLVMGRMCVHLDFVVDVAKVFCL